MKKTLFNYALVIASALCLSGCEEQTYSAQAQYAQAQYAQAQYAQAQYAPAQSKVKCYKPTGDVRYIQSRSKDTSTSYLTAIEKAESYIARAARARRRK
jgi:hypothetical protein